METIERQAGKNKQFLAIIAIYNKIRFVKTPGSGREWR